MYIKFKLKTTILWWLSYLVKAKGDTKNYGHREMC